MNFNRNKIKFLVPIFLLVVFLVWPRAIYAQSSFLVNFLGPVFEFFVYTLGNLLLVAIRALISIASFNDFVNAGVVNIGWVIIRDVANMAIVIVLLVIAFNTVLNKSNYGYQQMLPKLILAAIAINFSKVILGLVIDVSQVVMMTFVHAFEDIAAGNLTYGFGLHEILSARTTAKGAGVVIDDWSILGAMALAVVMVFVALVVVVTMVVMLLSRIVIIWIALVFSPLFFIVPLFPGSKQYIGQIQEKFTKNVIVGPILAFMFWLSMSVLSQVTAENRLINLEMKSQVSQGATQSELATFASKASSPQRIFDYMVTTTLLIACMITAQSVGAQGSKFAGQALGKLEGAGKWIAKRPSWAVRTAGKGAKAGLKATAGAIGRSNLAYGAKAHWEKFKDETAAGKRIKSLSKKERDERAEERKARQMALHGGEKHKDDYAKLKFNRIRDKYNKDKKEKPEKFDFGNRDDFRKKMSEMLAPKEGKERRWEDIMENLLAAARDVRYDVDEKMVKLVKNFAKEDGEDMEYILKTIERSNSSKRIQRKYVSLNTENEEEENVESSEANPDQMELDLNA